MSSKPAKRRCGADSVASEYVCVDGARVAATNASAIAHDRRVRALIDAAHRLSSFVPAGVAMSDYVAERAGRSVSVAGRGTAPHACTPLHAHRATNSEREQGPVGTGLPIKQNTPFPRFPCVRFPP